MTTTDIQPRRLVVPTIALLIGLLLLCLGLPAFAVQKSNSQNPGEKAMETGAGDISGTESDEQAIATFGGGCFWCVEAVFQELKGVASVKSGYMGGTTVNPTYQQICTGKTGHAEVIQIAYDPQVVSYEKLLEVFWATHDPTTLNRQGYDTGTQYRSVVFFHDDQQRQLAEKWKSKLDQSGLFKDPIVTEITAAGPFYEAEDYHQDYFRNNPDAPYCQANIPSKLQKLRKLFASDLKDASK